MKSLLHGLELNVYINFISITTKFARSNVAEIRIDVESSFDTASKGNIQSNKALYGLFSSVVCFY